MELNYKKYPICGSTNVLKLLYVMQAGEITVDDDGIKGVDFNYCCKVVSVVT